jgi:hypothetical protein
VERRVLSDDEIMAVVFELARRGAEPIYATDIRVAINEIIDELPLSADTDRVRRSLEAAGWEVIDDFPTPG